MIYRLLKLWSRRQQAKQWGISFFRCKDFRLPKQIILNGKACALYLPNESGVQNAFVDILLDDCYGLGRIKTPIKTILDIGANVGLFGLAAKRIFPTAILHAYEPNPNLEKYLKAQAETAGFQYFSKAVGLKKGKVCLDINPDSVLTRSRVAEDGSIPQISFREALDRIGGSADLVKMDCEGAEWEILKDRDSWQHIQHLSMEYHLWPNHTHEEMTKIIQGLGFRIRMQKPQDSASGLLLATGS